MARTATYAFAVAALAAAGAADAATINIASVTGSWGAVTGTATGLNGVGTEEIRFGTPFQIANPVRTDQSGYAFAGIFPSGPHQTGEVFDLGAFTHFNKPINSGTSIESAQLSVTLSFTLEGDATVRSLTSVFDFAHWETPNDGGGSATCQNGGANNAGVNINGCADRVTALVNPALSETFTVGNATYIFDVTGFTVNGQPFSEFWTTENQTNTAILQAGLRLIEGSEEPGEPETPPAPVPLPAAGWLLIAGLGGLGLAARRRKG